MGRVLKALIVVMLLGGCEISKEAKFAVPVEIGRGAEQDGFS